jgi:cold shock CspA family protein
MPTGKITKIEPIGDEDESYGYLQPLPGGAQKRFKESAVKGDKFSDLKQGDLVQYENHLNNQAKLIEKVPPAKAVKKKAAKKKAAKKAPKAKKKKK